MTPDAVLLVAHGTPTSLDDLPAFITNIRRGRPASAEIVEEVRRRYEAIGGRSPLLDVTTKQAELLMTRLGVPCFVAMRMWEPALPAVLKQLAEQHFERVAVIALTPHAANVYGADVERAARALADKGLRVPALNIAPPWPSEPRLIDAWADQTRAALHQLPADQRESLVLVPTAHSLPERVVLAGDRYPDRVDETVRHLMGRLATEGLRHLAAYQSQGMTDDVWLGPDLLATFRQARETGARSVLVVPIGFLSDHVETLYDLDIEAAQLAEAQGLGFARVPCLNTHPLLIETLGDIALRLCVA